MTIERRYALIGHVHADAGGVSDHGALTGLADDDHTQYHNDARGDARYSQLGHGHTASEVSDFSEAVDDRVASLIVAGTNITATYNDVANTLTLDATGGISDGDKGDIVVSGSGTVLTVDNGVVTNTKLADMITKTIKARKTGSTGAPEDCTLSEVLDFVTGATQGDLLYRGASSWARLPAGTDGQLLSTRGSGYNPEWAYAHGGALTYVTSAVVSGAAATSLSVSGLNLDVDGTYLVMVAAKNATASTATLSLTYNADTTATNYFSSITSNGASTQANNASIGGMFNTTSAEFLMVGTIKRPVSRVALTGTGSQMANSGTNIRAQGYAHQWTTTGTNVTGLTVTSSVASSLDIGTSITVWKYQKTTARALSTDWKWLSADQTVVSSTTMVDLNDLSFATVAGESYYFRFWLKVDCHATPDQKVSVVHTGTVANDNFERRTQLSGSVFLGVQTMNTVNTFTSTAVHYVTYEGTFDCTADGTLKVQFAQNTSSATAVGILKGSYCQLQRLN